MKSTKVKIPAKINLSLDILGKEDGYHNIRSLVASVNIYDTVVLKKRKDNRITLALKGLNCNCREEDNNAFKSAKLFSDRFNTCGVDIKIKKRIPLASGLGGSSADIAGVLIGMKNLFDKKSDILSLANEMGSDSGYMINGGYSVIYERGNKIIPVKSKIKIPAIIITDEKTISSKEGYAGFDKEKKHYEDVTINAVSELINNNDKFFKLLKNDLQPYAEKVIPSITEKIDLLKNNGAETALMTGSGSGVFGLFLSKKARNVAYKMLKEKYGDRIYKVHTF